MGDAFKAAGYDTCFIGKWHVDGHGRSNYIPPERRLGFETFQALECTHDYNQSVYYDGDDPTLRLWDGYDVFAQTEAARATWKRARETGPSCWCCPGTAHNPYETAPQEFRDMYSPQSIALRPNVPEDMADEAREWLAGYYAHCSAIDKSVGDILATLDELDLTDDTLLVFASDHGDMLGSQGMTRKQKPYEESIRVPFLLRYPAAYGRRAREVAPFLNAHDIMPTLLGVCGLPIPSTVEGRDFSPALRGESVESDAGLLACFHPFGEWSRPVGGREYRGIRTGRYTYCRTLDGPWLLFDNDADPWQLDNLANRPETSALQSGAGRAAPARARRAGRRIPRRHELYQQMGYPLDDTGTVPFRW